MKCIHMGITESVTTVDYKYNDEDKEIGYVQKQVSSWKPHDCIQTECACFIDGKCHYID